MNKVLYLKTADASRKANHGHSVQPDCRTGLNTLQTARATLDAKVKSLTAMERSSLLTALAAALERERRRCKGRKPEYDPGRHICLYAIVKALEAQAIKPPV